MSESNGLNVVGRSVLEYIDDLRKGGRRRKCIPSQQRKRAYSYSLSESYVQRIKELAELLGCSESEVVRRAVDEFYLKWHPVFRPR